MADPNPIEQRVGNPDFDWGQYDTNNGQFMRDAGAWNATDSYKKNQVVWYNGIEFIAVNDIPAGTAPDVIQQVGNPVDWVATNGTHGRGSMLLATPTTTPGSIPTGDNWVTVPFDTELYQPFGITFDLVNDTFDLDYNGLWDFNLLLSFSHNESNQGRQFTVRLYNATDSVGADGITVFIARNQPGTTVSIAFDFPVTDLQFADTFRFEVGDASSAIGSVVWESTSLIARQVGVLTQ